MLDGPLSKNLFIMAQKRKKKDSLNSFETSNNFLTDPSG